MAAHQQGQHTLIKRICKPKAGPDCSYKSRRIRSLHTNRSRAPGNQNERPSYTGLRNLRKRRKNRNRSRPPRNVCTRTCYRIKASSVNQGLFFAKSSKGNTFAKSNNGNALCKPRKTPRYRNLPLRQREPALPALRNVHPRPFLVPRIRLQRKFCHPPRRLEYKLRPPGPLPRRLQWLLQRRQQRRAKAHRLPWNRRSHSPRHVRNR